MYTSRKSYGYLLQDVLDNLILYKLSDRYGADMDLNDNLMII